MIELQDAIKLWWNTSIDRTLMERIRIVCQECYMGVLPMDYVWLPVSLVRGQECLPKIALVLPDKNCLVLWRRR
jgi:hypothetical protein